MIAQFIISLLILMWKDGIISYWSHCKNDFEWVNRCDVISLSLFSSTLARFNQTTGYYLSIKKTKLFYWQTVEITCFITHELRISRVLRKDLFFLNKKTHFTRFFLKFNIMTILDCEEVAKKVKISTIFISFKHIAAKISI